MASRDSPYSPEDRRMTSPQNAPANTLTIRDGADSWPPNLAPLPANQAEYGHAVDAMSPVSENENQENAQDLASPPPILPQPAENASAPGAAASSVANGAQADDAASGPAQEAPAQSVGVAPTTVTPVQPQPQDATNANRGQGSTAPTQRVAANGEEQQSLLFPGQAAGTTQYGPHTFINQHRADEMLATYETTAGFPGQVPTAAYQGMVTEHDAARARDAHRVPPPRSTMAIAQQAQQHEQAAPQDAQAREEEHAHQVGAVLQADAEATEAIAAMENATTGTAADVAPTAFEGANLAENWARLSDRLPHSSFQECEERWRTLREEYTKRLSDV